MSLSNLFTDIAAQLSAASLNKGVITSSDPSNTAINFYGKYTTGIESNNPIIITIDGVGGHPTFSFSWNGNVQSGIAISINKIFDLAEGISILFHDTSTLTIGMTWTYTPTATSVFNTIRLFNNQIKHEMEGNDTAYQRPACFIEFQPNGISPYGGNMYLYDSLIIRLHIVQEYYDSQDGNFNQDLDIFDIVESAEYCMHKNQPSGCDSLFITNHKIDYDHKNIIIHQLDFKTNYEFTIQPDYVVKYPITGLDLDFKKNIGSADRHIIINS